ncbi:unnamed protein product [Protopolystoma xenopodis]|uniref:Brix domain-containing protein n=1 Tax=Protopolystoma xenopodis TaxID=117903 RepID=A0A3S5A9R1_9PLAT|nr:unnamed protein product [Protopolystoma xenopodis]
MPANKRSRIVRKSRAIALSKEEEKYSNTPHTFVFARPGVGPLVHQLSLDLRHMMLPFTASRLQVSRRNVLKDLISVAGPLGVTHLIYLTHTSLRGLSNRRKRKAIQIQMKPEMKLEDKLDADELRHKSSERNEHPTINPNSTSSGGGGVFLHIVRLPRGPRLTFRVLGYSLRRDVQTLVRRVFQNSQYANPPLLAMTGFTTPYPNKRSSGEPDGVKAEEMDEGGTSKEEENAQRKASIAPPPPHLRLLVDIFQNMLPSLNVEKVKLSSVRRVLLLSREIDYFGLGKTNGAEGNCSQVNDYIHLRHYHIKTENRAISRPLRRLGLGGASLKKRSFAASFVDSSDRLSGSADINGETNKIASRRFGVGPGGKGKGSFVPDLSKYSNFEEFLMRSVLFR